MADALVDKYQYVCHNLCMARTSKYTKELLEPLVAQATSMGSLLDLLELKRTGGNYRHINQCLDHNQCDRTHWTGKAWNKSKTTETDSRLAKKAARQMIPDAEVFVENSTYAPSHLSKRLLKLGWKYCCKECNIEKWNDKPLTLHVDHINGTNSDHRLENLRFLCPNCHQQTSTWGNGTKCKQLPS
jgi:5-methylcytosine-specific restriction endonuclease McrA